MPRLFGTDGVRGAANRDLTAELALALGSAAARQLGTTAGLGVLPREREGPPPACGGEPSDPGCALARARRREAAVGRDPRASGEMLEAAVIAGLPSEGVDALRVGV